MQETGFPTGKPFKPAVHNNPQYKEVEMKEAMYTGTLIHERVKGGEVVRIGSSRELAAWASTHFFDTLDTIDQEKEHFIACSLNARNELKKVRLIAVGCLTGSLVHPREVFRPAVMDGAAAIVVAHNHPSGDPTPSPEDVQLTERLVEAGRILGIRLLDHVVVAERGYSSLMERGMA